MKVRYSEGVRPLYLTQVPDDIRGDYYVFRQDMIRLYRAGISKSEIARISFKTNQFVNYVIKQNRPPEADPDEAAPTGFEAVKLMQLLPVLRMLEVLQ